MNRQRGMTMVELMVSLAVVLLIIGAATTAYLKLLRTYRTQGRLAESYMANLTGLEMLRYDIETAGFGLPATQLEHCRGATYTEAPRMLRSVSSLQSSHSQRCASSRAASLRPPEQRRARTIPMCSP